MTATNGNEYRQLEIDSSNLLVEADRWRVLGRYALSAYAMLNACGVAFPYLHWAQPVPRCGKT
jgi:hypothetical protein